MPAVPGARRRDPVATRRLWAERLDRFRRANQTGAPFCAAEGVSVPSFWVWKRTLASDTTSPDPVTPTLVPIRLTTPPAGPPIEVVFPSGTVRRFPVDARPELIAPIVHATDCASGARDSSAAGTTFPLPPTARSNSPPHRSP